ncbi:MAG: hypothetical protein PHQ03_04805 [Methylococcales bacterium]|nr:hypothetical protein [Methylococcales bacterium]
MTELRAGVANTELETAINEIAMQLDIFNIDEAQLLLTSLQQQLEKGGK